MRADKITSPHASNENVDPKLSEKIIGDLTKEADNSIIYYENIAFDSQSIMIFIFSKMLKCNLFDFHAAYNRFLHLDHKLEFSEWINLINNHILDHFKLNAWPRSITS